MNPCTNKSQSSNSLTRRKFLATTALAVAGASVVPRHVLGGPKFVAPSAAEGKPLENSPEAAVSAAPETKSAEAQREEYAELSEAAQDAYSHRLAVAQVEGHEHRVVECRKLLFQG